MNIITNLKVLRSTNIKAHIEEAKDIIKKLDTVLKSPNIRGLGLSAPQIGINKCVAVVRSNEIEIDLVNPTIIDKSNGFVNFQEGCLSLPNMRIDTQRYNEIFVKDDLHPDGFVAIGDVAVIINHEIDHLFGILITDRSVGKDKIKRNDPCPCGRVNKDGKPIKWKKCHGRF